MTAKRTTMTFDAPGEPASVTIDPGTWALIEMGPFARTK